MSTDSIWLAVLVAVAVGIAFAILAELFWSASHSRRRYVRHEEFKPLPHQQFALDEKRAKERTWHDGEWVDESSRNRPSYYVSMDHDGYDFGGDIR